MAALNIFHQRFAITAHFLGGVQARSPQGKHGGKAAIFKFNAQVVHAQTVGDGGVNF